MSKLMVNNCLFRENFKESEVYLKKKLIFHGVAS